MADEQISDRIEALVKEEHELLDRGGSEGGLDPAGHERLEHIRVELDRYWDLLRQRRARRAAGRGPRGRQPARRRHGRALPPVTVELGAFVTPVADPEAVLEQVLAAERGGLELVGIQDHPYQRRFLDTFSLLAFLAARTERVRLFPAVANLPLRRPAMLAKAAVSIDVLSGGRFELGLGAGAFWDAIESFGGARRDGPGSVDDLEAAISILRACFAGERIGTRAVRAAAAAPDRHLARRLRTAHDARDGPPGRRLVPEPPAAAARRHRRTVCGFWTRPPSAPAATRGRSGGSRTSAA